MSIGFFVLGPLVAFLANASAGDQSKGFDKNEFIPLSFAKVTTDHKLQKSRPGTVVDKENNMVFDTDVHPLAIKVTYGGKVRDLPKNRNKFEKRFNKAIGKSNADFFSNYHKEVEVTEDSKSYWVAVQDDTLKSLGEKITAGANVTLFIRYLGQIGDEPISFVVNFAAE